MKLKISLGILCLILLSSCSTFTSADKNIANASAEIERGQMLPITATAQIGGETIQLEVARTPLQQSTGLMYRESLADDRGMLFPFEFERTARFWMKNVPITLDIIFLNGDRIVEIAENVPGCDSEPCPVYGPETLIDRVIELRGGRARELGVKAGDRISVEFLDSKQTENPSE
ncbi:MAG: DUF192 domain-containing protein [Cyanobacteria bacterium P01_G01_bin.19]